MTEFPSPSPTREQPLCAAAVLALAVVVALVSARPYAGSWNDGSRLATVECLVDYHTLAIEDSIFVRVPLQGEAAAGSPYPADEPALLEHGTLDKLFVQGHFYSDKSPVPALLMAVLYQGLQACSGRTARQDPAGFCYAMTVATSGLAYVVAVWCVFRLGLLLGLSQPLRLALTGSFALATVALPYSRHANNHILLLAVAAALVLKLATLATPTTEGRTPSRSLFALGSLAGLGYSIDLAAGPLLLLCTLGVVLYRGRHVRAGARFVLAALPWVALHHAVNFSTGGTWKPANAVPDYFQWPGCPFTAESLTGSWQHPSISHFLLYAGGLLAGKRGFLGHNMPLFLALPGLFLLLRRHPQARPELLFAGCWSAGTWLAYALTSTNSSGLCCSVRWFVPLLAPGYYVLALCLRYSGPARALFAVLSGWGAVLATLMWWYGPWMKHMVPFFWPIQGAALVSAGVVRVWQLRRRQQTVAPNVATPAVPKAA
jgi:hypothetical protein